LYNLELSNFDKHNNRCDLQLESAATLKFSFQKN